MKPLSATQCQQAVFEVAVELARQDKHLAALAAGLALPEDFDPDTLPSTVEMELYSRIQAVKSDHLQPTIVLLFAGAQLADADLRREFQVDRLAEVHRDQEHGLHQEHGLRQELADLRRDQELADQELVVLRQELADLLPSRDQELVDLRRERPEHQDGVSFRQQTQSPVAPGRKDTPC